MRALQRALQQATNPVVTLASAKDLEVTLISGDRLPPPRAHNRQLTALFQEDDGKANPAFYNSIYEFDLGDCWVELRTKAQCTLGDKW
jgi:hypothetical protein